MARGKKHTPEQIVNVLRQVEVAIASKTTPAVCKEAGLYGTDLLPLAQGIWESEGGSGEAAERAGAGEQQAQAPGSRAEPGQADPSGHRPGKLLGPERRRTAVEHARQCGASKPHACHLVHQPRGTQRYQPTQRNDEDALTRAIITLADRYGRYGYRRITIKLREAGWNVGKDRVERIWRREGLKIPRNRSHEDGCGSTTARACGCGRSIRIMSGRTTSSARSRTMEGRCACSMLSINTHGSA